MMYTRRQSGVRPSEKTTAASGGFFGGTERYGRGGMPLLIPQDYHGEFLREHKTASRGEAVMASSAAEETSTEAPVMDVHSMTWNEMTASSESDENPSAAVQLMPTGDDAMQASDDDQVESGSLLDGLYRLLIGESGAEEETLLLLAIALLLLWGHLDRGGLFDRSTWDSDDLALLLVGYLLIS